MRVYIHDQKHNVVDARSLNLGPITKDEEEILDSVFQWLDSCHILCGYSELVLAEGYEYKVQTDPFDGSEETYIEWH